MMMTITVPIADGIRPIFSAYPVRFFSSGRTFLQEIRQLPGRPALILLDRHMPDLDGHQTLVLLKQNPDFKRIPVVMLSSDPSPQEIEGCYEAGANSFLLKTLSMNL
jgi:CheY-like chemotaxis protein